MQKEARTPTLIQMVIHCGMGAILGALPGLALILIDKNIFQFIVSSSSPLMNMAVFVGFFSFVVGTGATMSGFIFTAIELNSLKATVHGQHGGHQQSDVGSVELFLAGAAVYLFALSSLSILLATLTNSMPQFALLSIPVFVIMFLLSGSFTPFESMPPFLQNLMYISPFDTLRQIRASRPLSRRRNRSGLD